MSYFTRSLGRAVLGANALAPRGNSRLLTAPSFFASWFTTELGAPLLLADARDTANFVRKGGLGSAKGRVAVGLRAAAAGVSLFQWRQATKAGLAFEQGFGDYADLDGLDGMPDFVPADPKGDLLPFFSGSKKRRRQKDVVFAEVDGVRNAPRRTSRRSRRPRGDPSVRDLCARRCLGDRRQASRRPDAQPSGGQRVRRVQRQLPAQPKVKAPDHVIDVSGRSRGVREHAEDRRRPDFIAISGGSAGGHLAALAALTSDDMSLQPSFEEADCSVQAAVPFTGVRPDRELKEMLECSPLHVSRLAGRGPRAAPCLLADRAGARRCSAVPRHPGSIDVLPAASARTSPRSCGPHRTSR
jgi:hypothetical protein